MSLLIFLGYIPSNINNFSIHNIIMPKRCPNGTRKNKSTGKCEPHYGHSAAALAYMKDPSDFKALQKMNRESTAADIKKLKRVLPTLKDPKMIAEIKAALAAGKKLGYKGGKRTSRKSRKTKTAKKRRH